MSLKHGLLGLINHSNSIGYDIDKIFKSSLCFFWKAQTSQIYREINNLVNDGLIKEKLVIQEGKPNKKILSITDKGKEELIRWLLDNNSVKKETELRSSIMMKLFFHYNVSIDDTIEFLNSLKDAFLLVQKSLVESQAVIDVGKNMKTKVYYQLCQNYGAHYAKSNLEWIDESLEVLYKIKNN